MAERSRVTTAADARVGIAALGDAGLVTAIARGEQEALAEVRRRYGSRIHSMARRICGDAGADDVEQEVLLRLWISPERYAPERGPLPAYLFMQTQARALDALRSDGSRRARESADLLHRAPDGLETGATPLGSLIGYDMAQALVSLPDDERRAIALAYVGGYSYREVASLLERPEGTIKSRVRRGLTRLRAQLASNETSTRPCPPDRRCR